MNEWLTVTTSSSAPTPSACKARCSAVVQLDTAQACGAPTDRANSSSKAATSGPCVTQPDRIARRAAAASSSPNVGLAMTSMMELSSNLALHLDRPGPRNEPAQTFQERHLGHETQIFAGSARVGQAPRHRVD